MQRTDCNGQQEVLPIRKKETHRDKDEAERVPLLDEKQGATPFPTRTTQASGSRPKTTKWGTDNDPTKVLNKIKRREAEPVITDGECEGDTPLDLAVCSTSTATALSDDMPRPPNGIITDTSLCNDDSEDTVIFKERCENERLFRSPGLQEDEETISNNVVMPLGSSLAQSSYGSLRTLDDMAMPDDIPMELNTRVDVMREIRKAEDKAKKYHLADLDTKIINALGMKLNPARGPSFLYVETLAALFPVSTDIYSNYKHGYISGHGNGPKNALPRKVHG